mmetsp:Transcript_56818/g.161230  ORF Transcript_56818/g.161230 Transcript_56818/m.161230 type:complete len:311 (-) Transcript_56818:4-936(-)
MDDCVLMQIRQAFQDLPKNRTPPVLGHSNVVLMSALGDLREFAPEVRLIHQIIERAVLEHLVGFRHVLVTHLFHQSILSNQFIHVASVGVLFVIELYTVILGILRIRLRFARTHPRRLALLIVRRSEIHHTLATSAQLPDHGVPSALQRALRHVNRLLQAAQLNTALLQTRPDHLLALRLCERTGAVEVKALEHVLCVREEPIRQIQLGPQLFGHRTALLEAERSLAVLPWGGELFEQPIHLELQPSGLGKHLVKRLQGVKNSPMLLRLVLILGVLLLGLDAVLQRFHAHRKAGTQAGKASRPASPRSMR